MGTDTLAVVALIGGPAAALLLAMIAGREISRPPTTDAGQPAPEGDG
jgi:hypothetical protein